MNGKELGKITRAQFGRGGRDDCMVGLSLTFQGKGWGVCDFMGFWSLERSERCEWSEDDRLKEIGRVGMKLAELLQKTGGKDVSDLVNKPVEVTFEGNVLKSWRLLEEVL